MQNGAIVEMLNDGFLLEFKGFKRVFSCKNRLQVEVATW